MIAVLALMTFDPARRIELWTSVLLTAGFMAAWWLLRRSPAPD
jgi:L-asparagine transporter-like permease